jgi:L-lysine 2,3-aminomutase
MQLLNPFNLDKQYQIVYDQPSLNKNEENDFFKVITDSKLLILQNISSPTFGEDIPGFSVEQIELPKLASSWLINAIEEIPHIKRLRIHSRLPVVIPRRITPTLVNLLKNTRLKAAVVLHINHANEIDDDLIDALEPLRAARIPLFNQSVLLKGINDKGQILIELSEQLFDAGIQPYYLHLFDQVQGAAHFDVKEQDAVNIVKAMLAALPGFLMPRLVREIAGQANKTPINLT